MRRHSPIWTGVFFLAAIVVLLVWLFQESRSGSVAGNGVGRGSGEFSGHNAAPDPASGTMAPTPVAPVPTVGGVSLPSPPRPVDPSAQASAAPAAVSKSRGRTASAARSPGPRANPDDGAGSILAATSIVDVLRNADLSVPGIRALAAARISEIQDAKQEAVYEKAARLGIPTRIHGPGRKLSILYDFRGDQPLYRTTGNVNAAISSGASQLRDQGAPYALDGTGVNVGIWDGGSVRSTHQEFGGRVTKKNASAANDDHATHVAGTIGASGVDPKAKGMAPKVTIDSYDWTSDYAEMTSVGAATGSDTAKIPLSNHSYGYNAVANDMGRYETEASTVDALAASLPYYLIFWAAGNEQGTLTAKGGYQSITFNALAKNIMTIGAVNDAVSGGVRTPSAGTMSTFSSWGPCDDGRIKPDVVANGVNLYSSVATSDTAYDGTYSGTSMATPSAMGSCALLEQLYAREFSGQRLRASMLRGLIIHTADDLGTAGPDYQYGWGLINVKAAADVILAHKASLASPKLVEGAVTNSLKTVNRSFTWDGSSPIRATLCWTDPAGAAQTAVDSRTPNLVNDLDLKITAPDGTTTYLPYTMPFVGTWTQASMSSAATRGRNSVDNVERVDIPAPAQPGNYTVTVSVNGSITNTSQAYSLIITGGVSTASNPAPTVTLDSPANGTTILQGTGVTLAASATDQTLGGGPGVVASVEFFNGTTSLGVDTTAPYSINWTPPASGTYVLSARATDSEGATASSASSTVTVLSGNGAPSISSFTPSSGTAGTSLLITGGNFAGVSAVRINGVNCTTFSVDSVSQITAVVPAAATTGPVTVVTSLGTATSSTNFTVVQSPVLISQIYGGGGQAGATYNADYVELYNRSGNSVSLAGWSVQYASAAGTSWFVTNLAGTLAPGKYYLVKMAGGASGSALPTADATGVTSLGGSSGKIALVNSTAALSGSSPVGTSGLQDFVGYGSANAYEGTAAAPSPTTTTAIFRAGGGGTDTGSNASDFSASAPNPRNSSGGIVAPVITSVSTAGGTVGSSFTYQITASNGPASYNATGLPAGVSVNTSTGLLSGTPTTTGTSNATISATNAAGTGSASLFITITGSSGGTQLLTEDFSSITGGDNTSTNGSGTTWAGSTNFPTVASAYQAGGTVKLGTGSVAGSITSRTLDLSGSGGNFTVSFKVKGWTTVEGSIKVTATGLSPQTVTYTSVMAGSFEAKTLNFTGGSANSTVKLETTAKRAFLDDIVIAAAAAASPTITINGTSLSGVTTSYGSASANPDSFVVSGANMSTGIVVTPPPGFEVSQSVGGASGYAATQTIGTNGTISDTRVYLRLAAVTSVGTYSGNVVCTSSGALPVSLATVASDVRPRVLTITASDQTKAFGTTLTLGAGQSAFNSSGLANGESVGTVTLSASGGLSAYDPPGVYTLTPSAVTGGTFSSSNYDITYQTGNLTVTGQDFATWMGGRFTGQNALPSADPEGDGLNNLLEFFMGLDPAVGDKGAIAVTVQGGQISMTYRKAKSATGVTGTAKWKSDLASPAAWSAAGVTDVLVSDQGVYEIRRASVAMGVGETLKFLRLELTTP